jgi:hypothetical protein
MKLLNSLIVCGLLFGSTVGFSVHASAKAPGRVAGTAATQTGKAGKKPLSRDINFNGASVDGRYHSAGDAIAQVEQEKNLNALIGLRKNFRDRLTAERDSQRTISNTKGIAQ